jgi:nitroreductase
MNVYKALFKRKSTRAFLKKEVEKQKIINILNGARYAPSGANTQPWQVAVVSGATKKEIGKALLHAYSSGLKEQKDYPYYPEKWDTPYRERRVATGMQLFGALGINRTDLEKRKQQWMANYIAFDAPVVLFFFMDSGLAIGSYMDYGMFLQSVMLAAVEEGLATCPQAALAEYPSVVKKILKYPAENILLCGMALGYEDKKAAVNSYRTSREDVETFTKFV